MNHCDSSLVGGGGKWPLSEVHLAKCRVAVLCELSTRHHLGNKPKGCLVRFLDEVCTCNTSFT